LTLQKTKFFVDNDEKLEKGKRKKLAFCAILLYND